MGGTRCPIVLSQGPGSPPGGCERMDGAEAPLQQNRGFMGGFLRSLTSMSLKRDQKPGSLTMDVISKIPPESGRGFVF